MKTEENILKALIAEPSAILRSGLSMVLKRIPGYRVLPIEISTIESLGHILEQHKPDLLIINPSFLGVTGIDNTRNESMNPELKIVALTSTTYSEGILAKYDEVIDIHDSTEQIKQRLDKLFNEPETASESGDENELLSIREKEILVLVVKGMTNKEIAQKLFLSTHTVVTHRRNIARKLEIHSTSGLTVYAIVNKLVELDDFK